MADKRLSPQPNAQFGLPYGLRLFMGDKLLSHGGPDPGGTAAFAPAVKRREGFVIANKSSLGMSFSETVVTVEERLSASAA